MASSDEEGEIVPRSVTNYHFVDDKDEPISFSILPIEWSGCDRPDGMKLQIFLHGAADSGLQKIYKQVTAWKFELSDEQPEISVLSKENKWIKLQKPRKSFEDTIRTILITLHCLHFVKKNPETSGKSLWDHLRKVFSLYEVRPSEIDLLDHLPLISEAVKKDESLAISMFLLTFLEEKPMKTKAFDEGLGDGLGLAAEVKAIPIFLCMNCQYKQHQCFYCGKLGSSNKSSGAEVFRCVSATCGHFYHPQCVVKLLHPGNKTAAQQLQEKIAAGESFTCPVHKCLVCKQGENKKVRELQFAMCRRCPKAYHRKCLPRKIAFEDKDDKNIKQRAWDKLLPDRILIYCLKHNIEEELRTPIRDHIIFPDVEGKKKRRPVELQSSREKFVTKKIRMSSEYSPRERIALKTPKVVEKVSSAVKEAKPVMRKSSSSLPSLEAEAEKRIVSLMKNSTSSITLEKIVEEHKVPSTHAYSSKSVVDKTITQGRVEGSVEAVRAALQKLEGGCSIEDAKAVCEPEILNQIIKWKNKLKVYLAPFLHGMRYTSFGRHFTKVDKLREGNANSMSSTVQIVDKLHWYVQNGDMIVDFCCGANDFSCLMKEKLEETGKKCSFKNYDVIQPKNDFNFEKRDWMSVHPNELPTGSHLIMGLNPPFGVRAALANKFIDKALEFKPKLLILIVPRETERLDEKEAAYDLVWEDIEKLSGKSFYLPGSVDVNDKQMEQWNVKPPVLYLWSRPDWTARHKVIAGMHSRSFKGQKELHMKENHNETLVSDHPLEVSKDYYGDIFKIINDYGPSERKHETEETRAVVPKGRREKQSHEIPKEIQDKGKQARSTTVTAPEDKQDGGRPQLSGMYKEMPPLVSSPVYRTDHIGSKLEVPRSEVLETPVERAANEDGFRGFPPSLSGSDLDFGRQYGGIRTSIPDDIAWRYSLSSEDHFASGVPKCPAGTNLSHDYGVRGLEEQFPSYMTDNVDSFGQKPYINELDENYRREADMRFRLQLYGLQDPDTLSQRSSYLPSQNSGFGQVAPLPSSHYGQLGLAGESSYNRMNLSAMQRYVLQLDELNHPRMSNLGSETPLVGRSGLYDTPGSQPAFRTDSLGFAPGPQHPFSHHQN
ncbi:hypothetical protein HHK36_023944 [Tetracentron sinense]|uniref:Zinc finger PHD-type domain-containing protein n=1 Tax=Tetracentron sinense TaxID=13715 RepID=A0A835D5N9_TETSI|nr:hypothetical protein HHK36_023944 [Tetracentron sinense]